MRAGRIFIEHDSFERLFARLAWIAVPNTAANKIDRSVVVHIQRSKADVREIIGSDEMLNPTVSRLKFEPEQMPRFHSLAAENEIQVSVPIHVHKGRQAIVAHCLVLQGQIAADEVMTKLKL